MSAQQSCLSSAAILQLTATPVAGSSKHLVRVMLLAPRHAAFHVAHTPPSAQNDTCCLMLANVGIANVGNLPLKTLKNP